MDDADCSANSISVQNRDSGVFTVGAVTSDYTELNTTLERLFLTVSDPITLDIFVNACGVEIELGVEFEFTDVNCTEFPLEPGIEYFGAFRTDDQGRLLYIREQHDHRS